MEELEAKVAELQRTSRTSRTLQQSATPPGTRGRVKRGKALNLLLRLDTQPCEIMGFFALPEAGVPYDNNQAEFLG